MYSSQPVPLIYSVVHETKNPAALSFLQERDHHTLEVESPEEVADLTRLALKYVPADRLILSSGCGMGELGVPEAECLMADPKFSLLRTYKYQSAVRLDQELLRL